MHIAANILKSRNCIFTIFIFFLLADVLIVRHLHICNNTWPSSVEKALKKNIVNKSET